MILHSKDEANREKDTPEDRKWLYQKRGLGGESRLGFTHQHISLIMREGAACLQLRLKPAAGAVQANLDRGERYIQGLGNLGPSQPIQVVQQNHSTVTIRQAFEVALDAGTHVVAFDDLL